MVLPLSRVLPSVCLCVRVVMPYYGHGTHTSWPKTGNNLVKYVYAEITDEAFVTTHGIGICQRWTQRWFCIDTAFSTVFPSGPEIICGPVQIHGHEYIRKVKILVGVQLKPDSAGTY